MNTIDRQSSQENQSILRSIASDRRLRRWQYRPSGCTNTFLNTIRRRLLADGIQGDGGRSEPATSRSRQGAASPPCCCRLPAHSPLHRALVAPRFRDIRIPAVPCADMFPRADSGFCPAPRARDDPPLPEPEPAVPSGSRTILLVARVGTGAWFGSRPSTLLEPPAVGRTDACLPRLAPRPSSSFTRGRPATTGPSTPSPSFSVQARIRSSTRPCGE